MKQIGVNQIIPVVLRNMMDKHPNEITIGDFKLNCFYVATVNGTKQHIAPTFQQATLNLSEWTAQFGLDHISFSLWYVNDKGVPCKWLDLSSNELYYLSIYNFMLRNRIPFISKGLVKFDGDTVIPSIMFDNYKEVYKDEILFMYFKDAPAWLQSSTGSIFTRRELESLYSDMNSLEHDFFNNCVEEPDLESVIVAI